MDVEPMELTSIGEFARRSRLSPKALRLQRHLTATALVDLGKKFIGRFRDGAVPQLEGVAGAPFVIFYGHVSEDSDGPVEWCRPVPAGQAAALAAQFPDLTLRT